MKRTFVNQNQYEMTLLEDCKNASCNQNAKPCKNTNSFNCNINCNGTNVSLIIDDKSKRIALTQENNCKNKSS